MKNVGEEPVILFLEPLGMDYWLAPGEHFLVFCDNNPEGGTNHAPIGLNIGAETPAEMAVAILAEIVESRARPGVPLALRGKVTAI